MIRLATIATLLLLAPAGYAQTGDAFQDALIAGLDRGAEESAAKIMNGFRQIGAADEIKVIDRLRVVIDRNGLRIGSVFTDGRMIRISSGFLAYSAPVSLALAYEIAEGLRKNANPDTDRVIAYTRYYVDGIRAQQAAFERGQPSAPLKTYLVWTGMSADAAQKIFASLDKDTVYQQAVSTVLVSSLAFVLGHELGHNVLDQLDPANNFRLRRPPNPEDEVAADAYGFQISIRAGLSPFFAVGIFMFLDAFERGPTDAPIAGDHPPALCRWGRAMIVGWNGIKDDSAFWEQARARGREDDVNKFGSLMRTAEDQLSVRCPGGTEGGEICTLVEKFLVGSADPFTADRGEVRRSNRWRSKSRLPNASCFQRQDDQTFTFSCIINSGDKSLNAQAYYDKVKLQLGACLAGHGGTGSWTVAPTSTNDSDQRASGLSYSRTTATASFEVRFDTTRDLNDGDTYNSLQLEYSPQ